MKCIHSCESVFGKMGSKGGGVVVSDATAANGLFGTAGTKMKVLNPLLVVRPKNYGIKNSTVFLAAGEPIKTKTKALLTNARPVARCSAKTME